MINSNSRVEKSIKIILNFLLCVIKNSKLGSKILHVELAVIGIFKSDHGLYTPTKDLYTGIRYCPNDQSKPGGRAIDMQMNLPTM